MLNRHAATASALIVIRGALRVGVSDDDAELGEGDGVLLEAATTYSLQASEESVAVVFALSGAGENVEEAEGE
jgi:quercetin dioxygenase-like cupin family protein